MSSFKLITFAVFAFLIGSFLSAPASAQTASDSKDSLEEIVVRGELSRFGATKSEAPASEISRSVSVITADEFLEKGALTLSNTLEYTAGVVSNAFGYATRGDFTSIRGLDAPEYQDNLQVLFGFYNNSRADIYTLEQVEVLKGPASVLYGQSAPGGIVSTISKIAGPDNLGKELTVSAGNFDRLQASLDVGFDWSGDGRWTARFVALARDADTQVDFVNDDALVVAPSLSYTAERTSLTALLNYTKRESDTSAQFLPLAGTACATGDVTISEANVCGTTTGQEAPESVYVGDPNFNRYDTEALTFSLFGTHQFTEALMFEGTARYRDNDADYNQTWISFLGDGNPRILANGTAVGRSWSSSPAGSRQLALDARLRASFNTGVIEHELLAGLNYQDVDVESNSAFLYARPTAFNIFNPVYDGSEVPSAPELDAVRAFSESETIATDVYLTNIMLIGDLVFNAGIRFSSVDSKDVLNNQKDDETPLSFGALYRSDWGLNPYVSYAESFRATVGTDVLTGSPLEPRSGEQTEVGLKWQGQGSSSFVTFAYFDLEEDNLVDFVPGGQTQPGLSIETKGFEIEAYLEWRDFTLDFNYRVLDADDVDENGVAITRPSLPENAGSLWATWEPAYGQLDGFRFGLGLR
ncbi:MAG: TonB-dependent receptor plug domain-containing protein, partial [Pseudomonadota bacterium]